jgi:hypothetical protein
MRVKRSGSGLLFMIFSSPTVARKENDVSLATPFR